MSDKSMPYPRSVFRLLLAGVLVLALLAGPSGCSFETREQTTKDGSSAGYGVSGSMPSQGPNQTTSDETALSAVSPEGASEPSGRSGGGATSTDKQLMIRTANMRVQVKDVDTAVKKLRALTKDFHGLVEALQVSSQEDVPIYRPADAGGTSDVAPLAAYATVRVPQERFDEFLTRVTALGKVLVQSEQGTDVTQQHIDMTARLATLKAEEARLREFLKAAKNVEEMLAVESELSRVRGEIESMQAQLDYLDKQIALSALTVELVRPTPVVQPAGTDWGFADALRNGIRGAAAVLTSMITVLISALPLILVVVLVAFVWIAIARARRRRRDVTPAEEQHEGAEGA